MTGEGLLALDWGTTAARAYRLDAAGRVDDVRSAPLGVQHVEPGGFAAALEALLGDWKTLPLPRLAAGMIGSRQGWVEAPYCETPASLRDLAAGIVEVPGGDLRIVPGVRTRDEGGMPDVMRGEETQIIGAVDPALPLAFAVLPGTHSKWARIERGAIAGFTTFMTGEVYGALVSQTILGRLVPPAADGAPGPVDSASFERGVARALAQGPLLHDVFGARTLALFGELAPAGIADWLSGLLIGSELTAARRIAPDMAEVIVVGTAALAARYLDACAMIGLAARAAPPDAAALGLWRIAQALS